jgi:hypothetical protein
MAAAARSTRATRIPLDEFTQLAFESVIRASELRKLPPNRFPGPIIFGIIWWPQGLPSPGGAIGSPRVGG